MQKLRYFLVVVLVGVACGHAHAETQLDSKALGETLEKDRDELLASTARKLYELKDLFEIQRKLMAIVVDAYARLPECLDRIAPEFSPFNSQLSVDEFLANVDSVSPVVIERLVWACGFPSLATIVEPADPNAGPDRIQLVADGTINGRHVTFLVDTGAMNVLVSRETAKNIGLPDSGKAVLFRGISGSVWGHWVDSNEVCLDTLCLENLRVGVIPSETSTILGMSFLSKFGMTSLKDRFTIIHDVSSEYNLITDALIGLWRANLDLIRECGFEPSDECFTKWQRNLRRHRH